MRTKHEISSDDDTDEIQPFLATTHRTSHHAAMPHPLDIYQTTAPINDITSSLSPHTSLLNLQPQNTNHLPLIATIAITIITFILSFYGIVWTYEHYYPSTLVPGYMFNPHYFRQIEGYNINLRNMSNLTLHHQQILFPTGSPNNIQHTISLLPSLLPQTSAELQLIDKNIYTYSNKSIKVITHSQYSDYVTHHAYVINPILLTNIDALFQQPKIRNTLSTTTTAPNTPPKTSTTPKSTQNSNSFFINDPILFHDDGLDGYNTATLPIPPNPINNYRYITTRRINPPAPPHLAHLSAGHSSLSICYSDFFPQSFLEENHLTHTFVNTTSIPHYEKLRASWFTGDSSSTLLYHPHVPSHPYTTPHPANPNLMLSNQHDHWRHHCTTAWLRTYDEGPDSSHPTPQSEKSPFFLRASTIPESLAINHSAKQPKFFTGDEDGRLFFDTHCGSLFVMYGSINDQRESSVSNNFPLFANRIINIKHLFDLQNDPHIKWPFEFYSHCKLMYPEYIRKPYPAELMRDGQMDRFEKNWSVLSAGFGEIFNFNLIHILSRVLSQDTPHRHVYDVSTNTITLKSLETWEKFQSELLNYFVGDNQTKVVKQHYPFIFMRYLNPLNILYNSIGLRERMDFNTMNYNYDKNILTFIHNNKTSTTKFGQQYNINSDKNVDINHIYHKHTSGMLQSCLAYYNNSYHYHKTYIDENYPELLHTILHQPTEFFRANNPNNTLSNTLSTFLKRLSQQKDTIHNSSNMLLLKVNEKLYVYVNIINQVISPIIISPAENTDKKDINTNSQSLSTTNRYYVPFVVFLNPITLEQVGIFPIKFKTGQFDRRCPTVSPSRSPNNNAKNDEECSKSRQSTNFQYTFSLWENSTPLSLQVTTPTNVTKAILLPHYHALSNHPSQFFLSVNIDDTVSYFQEIDMVYAWENRLHCDIIFQHPDNTALNGDQRFEYAYGN